MAVVRTNMIEYIKFWIAKEMTECLIGIGILVVATLLFTAVAMWTARNDKTS